MKLSVSNIAWRGENDLEMYQYLADSGITGLEIAPTRIFPVNPYDDLNSAAAFASKLKENFGLVVSSMQAIWYGLTENIFDGENERNHLLEYTKKAIRFAHAIECKNIVFGCPRNRAYPEGKADYMQTVYDFFNKIGEYALALDTCIALEPNPVIYNTNFINTSAEAVAFCKAINCPGIKVNLDFGTILANGESIAEIAQDMDWVNHIHLSEPHLVPILEREEHIAMRDVLLCKQNTQCDMPYVSIEMANTNHIKDVQDAIKYVRRVFCGI
ncbi:MAG: sugar phosphate isomerase/epimerase [Defluviitaleaceae bacterium]|nr:sugar phosphate isomerase/epimerase [Defluviitaleaceae bacterium]